MKLFTKNSSLTDKNKSLKNLYLHLIVALLKRIATSGYLQEDTNTRSTLPKQHLDYQYNILSHAFGNIADHKTILRLFFFLRLLTVHVTYRFKIKHFRWCRVVCSMIAFFRPNTWLFCFRKFWRKMMILLNDQSTQVRSKSWCDNLIRLTLVLTRKDVDLNSRFWYDYPNVYV